LKVPCQPWGGHVKSIDSINFLLCKEALVPISKTEKRHIPEKLLYDSRLVRTRDGKYYFCVPRILEHRANEGDNQARGIRGIIALDPGVRTFMTGYDPSGKVLKWGHHDMSR